MLGLTIQTWAHAHIVGLPLVFILLIALAVIHDSQEKGIFDRPKGRNLSL